MRTGSPPTAHYLWQFMAGLYRPTIRVCATMRLQLSLLTQFSCAMCRVKGRDLQGHLLHVVLRVLCDDANDAATETLRKGLKNAD